MQSFNEFDFQNGYVFSKYDDHVIIYKLKTNYLHIPEVTHCIHIDSLLHVNLFLKGSSVPLPQWFRHGHNCMLTSKTMLENFPTYLKVAPRAEKTEVFRKF